MVEVITKCSARLTIAVPTGCNTRTFQVKFGGQTSMCLANTSFFLLNASVWSLVWFDNTLLCFCSCHLLGIWGTQGGEPGTCFVLQHRFTLHLLTGLTFLFDYSPKLSQCSIFPNLRIPRARSPSREEGSSYPRLAPGLRRLCMCSSGVRKPEQPWAQLEKCKSNLKT